VRFHNLTIDEASLRAHIEHKVKGDVDDHLREIICQRISLAYNILDFLKRIGR